MPPNIPSLYPNSIDGYSQLQFVTNEVTEINQTKINTIIDAIFKIENAIGVNPEGSKADFAERFSVAHNLDGTIKPIPIELLTAEPAQDRNILLDGGGIIHWDLDNFTLSWSSNLIVRFPASANSPTLLTPNSVLLPGPGYVLAVQISRSGAPQIKTPIVRLISDPVLNDNDSVILAWRDATNRIHFRNGAIYEDGDMLPFERIDATRIEFQPGGTSFPLSVTDVQSALENLDTRTETNNSDLSSLIALKESESITRDNNLQTQVDDIFNDEDRNLFMLGGGKFSFNNTTGELSFTEDVVLYQTTLSADAIIPAGSITFPSIGSIAYLNLNRFATTDYNPTITVDSGPIASNSTLLILAIRIANNAIRLFNGSVIFGESVDTPVLEGELTATNVRFDNSSSVLPNSPEQVQSAIDELVARLNSLDTTVGGNNFVPPNALIMMLGDTCPAGFLEVPELDGLFPRFGVEGSLDSIGSNSHAHTGSTNTTGNHSHTAGSYKITLPVVNFELGGAGVPFDAFNATFNGDTSTPSGTPIDTDVALSGSSNTTGNHSHTFTTVSQNHVPQHAIVKICRSA